MKTALLLPLLLLLPPPAMAHKVIADVFASGDQIEGEIGFSNGEMAALKIVEIFDDAGVKLGEVTTDSDGFFTFTPQQPITHIFRSDLGAGHVASATMTATDVGHLLGKPAATTQGAAQTTAQPLITNAQATLLALIVRDEMRPLRREIAAYKEKNNLQTILGGLGYIAGLFGLGFYIAARRKLEKSDG